ncbi:hypothetical protein cypCar_00018113 [Cyprinus carpio]|nr:hypothetical protein cypCar_00018113 [Cyprinus carpio]
MAAHGLFLGFMLLIFAGKTETRLSVASSKEKLNNEVTPSHRDLAPDFKEKYFKQILDHFNYNSLGNGTYDQRYLITDQYWKKGNGPIFFYTGNEGDIWEFAQNSGFITELAAVQGALVIFAEHHNIDLLIQDFEKFKPACRDAVQGAFQKLNTLAQQKDYRRIQSAFFLCKTPSTPKDIHQLNGFLRNAFTMMAMLDYPYSTHFMGSMPAFPVKVACETMLNGTDLMSALRDTVGIVYNSTGQLTCYDLYSLYVECADPTGCGLGFDSYAWDYQACTEIEMCFESNNVTDMFPPMTFTEQQREQYCSKRWGVVPRPGWLKTQFWGDDLSTASNIIFSNGDLDPWANGGIRKTLSPSLIAINIPEGAHHLDLRESNPNDPESVIVARKESEIIAQWVQAAMKESS